MFQHGNYLDGLSVQKNGHLAKGARKARIKIGLIFQQFNLINRLSVLTNVLIGGLGSIPIWRGALSIFNKAEKICALQNNLCVFSTLKAANKTWYFWMGQKT